MTVRRLAGLLRPSGPVGPLPEGPGAWTALLELADAHRLRPALWSSLAAAGLARPVPEAVRATAARHLSGELPEALLEDAHRANAARVDDLLDQARSILAALGDAGVDVVPLKGTDALLRGRYPDPAARTMTDVDLLLREPDLATATTVLHDLGYRPAVAEDAEHHLAPLVRTGRLGSVELHHQVLRGRWRDLLPGAVVLDRAERSAEGRARRLEPADAAAVLIAHAQLQDEGRLLFDLPLRALHETAVLLAGAEEVDWGAVAARLPGAVPHRALEEHLHLAATLFGVHAPLPVGRPARRRVALLVGTAEQGRLRAALGQVAFLPRSFSAERMVALHGGPARGAGLWATRARHAAAGARRRLRPR